MAEDEKKRSPVSQALIDLRKAMGKTQQTFAVEVLKTAIGTIARYESYDPPRGDVLLRLRDIAREQGLEGAADQFQLAWLDGIHKLLGDVRSILKAEDGTGLMVVSLEPHQFAEAKVCLQKLISNRRKRKEAQ